MVTMGLMGTGTQSGRQARVGGTLPAGAARHGVSLPARPRCARPSARVGVMPEVVHTASRLSRLPARRLMPGRRVISLLERHRNPSSLSSASGRSAPVRGAAILAVNRRCEQPPPDEPRPARKAGGGSAIGVDGGEAANGGMAARLAARLAGEQGSCGGGGLRCGGGLVHSTVGHCGALVVVSAGECPACRSRRPLACARCASLWHATQPAQVLAGGEVVCSARPGRAAGRPVARMARRAAATGSTWCRATCARWAVTRRGPGARRGAGQASVGSAPPA